ncbi:MAG: hypothetical protein V4610_05770 [Pseudomonadota bacterium]|jgi:hypothetical protein
MSMPGFTATNSLTPTTGAYYGGASLLIDSDGMVEPQFLDFIREAIESIGDALSSAARAAISGLSDAISNMQNGQGQRGFACSSWIGMFARCNGRSPNASYAEMLTKCIESNRTSPDGAIKCSTVVSAFYPLMQKVCSEGGNTGNLLNDVCKGT